MTAAAAPFDGQLPGCDGDRRAAARERAERARARAPGPTDAVDAQLVLAADQFVIATPTAPTAVAGYPWFGEWSRDLMTSYEGLFLATRRFDEGRELLRRAAGDRLGGHARQHGRHRDARVQHRRRHALVRARARPPRRRHRRRRPRRPSSRRRSTEIVSRHLDGHALRDRRRSRRRAAAPGRRGPGADLDGRPHRRRAGHAAARARRSRSTRSGSRRSRSPARLAGDDRAGGARCDARGPRSRAGSPDPTAAACSTSSTGPPATTRRVRPNQLLAVSLPARAARGGRRRSRAASSTPAARRS